MKKRPFIRLALEAALVLGLYAAGLAAMLHWRVMEVILAPGSHSVKPYVALAIFFLMLRAFIVFALPGYVLARVFLVKTASHSLVAPASPSEATSATTTDLT